MHSCSRSLNTSRVLHGELGRLLACACALQSARRCFATTPIISAPSLSSPPSRNARGSRRGGGARHKSNSSRSRRSSSRKPSSGSKLQHGKTSFSKSGHPRRGTQLEDVERNDDDATATKPKSEVDANLIGEMPSSTAAEDVIQDTKPTGASARQAAQTTFTSPDAGQTAESPSSEPGWGLETVDTATGKTALEELYDRNLSRIHRVLEQPLPPMPQDGSVDPDFFVGFASYSYQLRDQYRAVIARELQVPVKAVRLSIAWSGRFNVKRFNRVQKVCGVYLDRNTLAGVSEDPTRSHASVETKKGKDVKEQAGRPARQSHPSSSSSPSSHNALPEVVAQRITALVTAINTQKREDLLQVQLFQASPPIPEVEFALTRQEHRLLYRLHEWTRHNVLQRTVAVVVYGAPPTPLPPSPQTSGEASREAGASRDKVVRHHYDQWQRRATEESAAQHREVQSRWLRLFHRREVVPLVLSLTELATRVAVAVARGEVTGVACERKDCGDEEDTSAAETAAPMDGSVQLSGSLRDLLLNIAAVAASSSSSSGAVASVASSQKNDVEANTFEGLPSSNAEGEAPSRQAFKDALLLSATQTSSNSSNSSNSSGGATIAAALDMTSAAQQEAVMRWVRLVFQALLLREGHSEQTAGPADDAASGSAASWSVSMTEVSLPALFVHGAYAGSRDAVVYLQHNRAAMDALLLHPHEISLKKKFVSRLRNGHRRRRMEEEAAALHSTSG